MNEKLVSIITVTYNAEKFLIETIESVLNQTYSNIEYIIIDGGSTDNTLNIIKSYVNKFEGRLKYISEKDNGLYDAMNKGIKLSKGSIIGIINSDDYYMSDTVEKVVNVVNKHNVDIVYGNVLRQGIKDIEDLSFIIKSNYKNLNRYMSVSHPTCFLTKELYLSIGNFDTSYKIAADYDLLSRCKRDNRKFYHIDDVLAFYRLGGINNKYYWTSYREGCRVRKSYTSKGNYLKVGIKEFINLIYPNVRNKILIMIIGEKKFTKLRRKRLMKKLNISNK